MEKEQLANILEAAIMAYNAPLSLDKMQQLFEDKKKRPTTNQLKAALTYLKEQYACRAVSLQEVANGYRFQSKQDYAPWLVKLWEEKPPRYSRATLETLVLIAYRQPVTRAEIEDVRGVSVSSHIIRSLLEREWIRVVGHRDVPGKPGLYGTTKHFLDYFNLTSLNELPTLAEVQDLEILGNQLNEQLDFSIDNSAEETEERFAATDSPEEEHLVESDESEETIVDEIRAEDEFEMTQDEDAEETKATFFDIVNKFGQSSANDTTESGDETNAPQQAISHSDESTS